MNLYFYRSAPQANSQDFHQYYLPHNIRAVRLLSRVWLVIAILVLASNYVVDFGHRFQGAAFYRVAYTLFLTAGLSVYLFDRWLRTKPAERVSTSYRYLYLAYAFVFAVTCLLMSVAVQGSPINNMTMYLLGLSLIAVLFVLELKELLLLATAVELTFVGGVMLLDLPVERIIMNHTGSLFLILFFYFISRLNFSFRYNHFLQLRLIEQKNAELEQLSKAKTQILGVVAHDLRTPFANIEMMASMLIHKPLSPEQQARFFELILKSCQSSKGIINELLEMARYDQEGACAPEPTKLDEFLDHLELEWQLQLKGTRQLQVQKDQEECWVNLDVEKFRRVLDNLLSNAVKFTQEQGNIMVRLMRQDSTIKLEVSDNGIGIPEAMRPHLFEPFSRAGRKGLRGEQTVGLGLSIARKLVEMHQGTLELRHGQEQGTTFRISLPAFK